MDLCIVGERGVGKTVLSRAFAEVLGYRTYNIFCFKASPSFWRVHDNVISPLPSVEKTLNPRLDFILFLSAWLRHIGR